MASLLSLDMQMGAGMESWDLCRLRQLDLCCRRLKTQSSDWIWVQSTGGGMERWSKRMHKAAEIPRPQFLPTAMRHSPL